MEVIRLQRQRFRASHEETPLRCRELGVRVPGRVHQVDRRVNPNSLRPREDALG